MQPVDESTARASIDIAAPPDVVYSLLADVARMGRYSPEATGAAGAPVAPGAGDRFWGLNKRGLMRWFTRCTVRQAEPGRRFVFDVDFPPAPVSRWIFDIEPTNTGCRVTETWQERRFGPFGKGMRVVGSLMIPGPRAEHNQRNIEITLQRLKAVAEE